MSQWMPLATHRTMTAVGAGIGFFVLSACTSNDDSPPMPDISLTAPLSDARALETAVRRYAETSFSGDAKGAYELLSDRCKEMVPFAEFRRETADSMRMYRGTKVINYTEGSREGSRAKISVTLSRPEINQDFEPWVRDPGGWHEDDC